MAACVMIAFGAHRIITIIERSADADLLRRAARLDSRLMWLLLAAAARWASGLIKLEFM